VDDTSLTYRVAQGKRIPEMNTATAKLKDSVRETRTRLRQLFALLAPVSQEVLNLDKFSISGGGAGWMCAGLSDSLHQTNKAIDAAAAALPKQTGCFDAAQGSPPPSLADVYMRLGFIINQATVLRNALAALDHASEPQQAEALPPGDLQLLSAEVGLIDSQLASWLRQLWRAAGIPDQEMPVV
jgi:hypothetical protein